MVLVFGQQQAVDLVFDFDSRGGVADGQSGVNLDHEQVDFILKILDGLANVHAHGSYQLGRLLSDELLAVRAHIAGHLGQVGLVTVHIFDVSVGTLLELVAVLALDFDFGSTQMNDHLAQQLTLAVHAVVFHVDGFGDSVLRTVDDKVIDYERVHPSFTIDLPDGNFAFCRADYTEDYGEFYENARKSVEQAKLSIEQGDKAHFETNNCADLIYVSCLPWIDFVSVSNPLPYTDKLSMSIPRMNWGKFAKVQDRYETTLSVTFNHALMDGREASYMLLYLEELLRDAEKYLTR